MYFKGGLEMAIVGRHINGITINPLEYLLDDNDEVMEFISEDAAKEFLKGKGFTDDEFYSLTFEEVSKRYLKVGQYTPAKDEAKTMIEREFYGQGYIFKDEEAYDTGLDNVCYIPELSDAVYTHQSFLDLMDGQEELARDLFDCVDWQHPETLLEEDYINGEYDDCQECGRMFACYDRTECPYCHS
jgi:hypothetical protein